MKSLCLWFCAVIALVAHPALADGSLSSYPSSDACAAERTAGLVAGYEVGLADGNAQGFTRGQVQGWNEAVAYCIANPAMCGIAFASCLPAPTYGETEPNDNIVAANALPFDVGFWGQSYGPVDEDWFYIVTTQPNQNLTINFSVPNGSIFGYKVAIRDAAGNLFADFDTSAPGSVPAPEGEVAYRVTLGFVGTYYIVVETAPGVANYSTYNLAAVLQDSPLDAQNYIVGFYDVELEPNDLPAASTMLTTGVTMYGLINLTFDQTVPDSEGTSVWAQGADSDWYGYYSSGSEVVTLTFCAREQCEPGNWQVEVYGTDETNDVVFGSGTAKPILSINTDTTSTSAPLTYRLGLPSAGMYYMRVNHKRLYTAPCAQYELDLNSDGDTTDPDETKSCSCTSGNSCDVDAVIPKSSGTELVTGEPPDQKTSYFCPNGDTATEVSEADIQCSVSCECVAWRGVVVYPENATTSQYNFSWYSTQLPPNTHVTDGYQDFLSRPNPYR